MKGRYRAITPTNKYDNIPVPEWVKTAPRHRLIAHIQYLIHERDKERNGRSRTQYRIRKAEKILRENGLLGEDEHI